MAYTATQTNEPIFQIEEGLILNTVQNRYNVSGIALMFFVAWNRAHELYKEKCTKEAPVELGTMQGVRITDKLVIINLFCEVAGENNRVFVYDGFHLALDKLITVLKKKPNQTVYVPSGLGSGIQNGDWERTKAVIVEKLLPHANVIICNRF